MNDKDKNRRSGTIRILLLFAICLVVGVCWTLTGLIYDPAHSAVDTHLLELVVALSAFLSATLLLLSEFPESIGANDVKSRRK